eukprot:27162-Amphidinium_carterae.3
MPQMPGSISSHAKPFVELGQGCYTVATDESVDVEIIAQLGDEGELKASQNDFVHKRGQLQDGLRKLSMAVIGNVKKVLKSEDGLVQHDA